jgi:hypothetical protein
MSTSTQVGLHSAEKATGQGEALAALTTPKVTQTKLLTTDDVKTLSRIATDAIAGRGADFYGWRNAPTYEDGKFFHVAGWGAKPSEISPERALQINQEKLDGAYGERFALTVALLGPLVERGVQVALLQVQKEEGLPFNAQGWVVVSINGFPLFHISPTDLPLAKVKDAGLVTVVTEGSPEAKVHGWKGTNKVQELSMLLDLATK